MAGAGQARLTWTSAAPGAWHWVYLRDRTAGQREFVRSEVPVNGPGATLNLLTGGHEYEFKVVQFNPAGEAPSGPTIRATRASQLPR